MTTFRVGPSERPGDAKNSIIMYMYMYSVELEYTGTIPMGFTSASGTQAKCSSSTVSKLAVIKDYGDMFKGFQTNNPDKQSRHQKFSNFSGSRAQGNQHENRIAFYEHENTLYFQW